MFGEGAGVRVVARDDLMNLHWGLVERARDEVLHMCPATANDHDASARHAETIHATTRSGARWRTLCPEGISWPDLPLDQAALVGRIHRYTPGMPPAYCTITDRSHALLWVSEMGDAALQISSQDLITVLRPFLLGRWALARPCVRATPSGRRASIVALLAEGLTDAVIARRLNISARTVAADIAGLMREHQVESRFQLGMALANLGVDLGR